ncbi:MAG: hypothetical protein AAFN92_04640 [Bacteroidota bacterium]
MKSCYQLLLLLLLPALTWAQGPIDAPAPPTREAENVLSIFSDAYDDAPVDTYRTDWSNGQLTDTTIAGNAVKLYTVLGFVGFETVANPIDLEAAGMTHLHVDYWSPNITSFRQW